MPPDLPKILLTPRRIFSYKIFYIVKYFSWELGFATPFFSVTVGLFQFLGVQEIYKLGQTKVEEGRSTLFFSPKAHHIDKTKTLHFA
jgi:hypothetical protein